MSRAINSFFMALVLAVCLQGCAGQQKCHYSVKGVALKDHVIENFTCPNNIGDCIVKCVVTQDCESINYYGKQFHCELNNRTIENAPEYKVFDSQSTYFENQCKKLLQLHFKM